MENKTAEQERERQQQSLIYSYNGACTKSVILCQFVRYETKVNIK